MSDDEQRPLSQLEQIIEKCRASRERRRSIYRQLRLWYTRGTAQSGEPAMFNRLHAHIENLASYIYSPESARFLISLPPSVRKNFLEHVGIAKDEFKQRWRNSGCDVDFALVVEWAGVYGSMICKVMPGENGAVRFAPINPGDFCVLREDVPSLDRQDAMVHFYATSLSELERKIKGKLGNADAIMAHARGSVVSYEATQGGAGLPKSMQEVIVTSVGDPTTVQGVLDLQALGTDRAEVAEDIVELAEVWRRCEYRYQRKNEQGEPSGDPITFSDWKVTTCLDMYELWETRNPVLPWLPPNVTDGEPTNGELGFVKVVTSAYLDFFWGRSEIAGLLRLQEFSESMIEDIRDLIERQLDPGGLITGVPLTPDKIEPIRKRGGWVSTANPQGKMQPNVPQMPPQAFDLLNTIGQMFNEEAGMPEELGTAAQDIRVQGQIGATGKKMARMKRKALVVEDALEVLATRMFHIMQRNDPAEYTLDDGTKFRLADIPLSAVVKVEAHSASPINAEQVMEKALVLQKAGEIDGPTLVDLVDPPGVEELKEKAKKIDDAKAQHAKDEQRIEELKVTRPARR